MKKIHIKYLATLLAVLMISFVFIGTVKATEEIEIFDFDFDLTDKENDKDTEKSLEVSHRDLALASALSYLGVSANKTISNSNIDIVTYFNEKFNLYYYGTTKEIDEWTVVDYQNKIISQRGMTAFTLKKNNNIIVVFRGTDTEGVEDVIGYGVDNYHAQESFAEAYILKMANKYAKEGEYNFYITGHSLGGYLSQIAGSTLQKAIDNANNGTTDWNGWNLKNKYTLNDYLDNGSFGIYKNITLKEVVAFNGMGIECSTFFKQFFGDKYTYQDQSAKVAILKKLGSEGKLIDYYVYGDLVSGLGTFYGEMRRITPSIDAVTNRRITYKSLNDIGAKLQVAKKIFSLSKKYNALNTDIDGAQKLYDIENIIIYLLLTHEPDTFATILETEEEQSSSATVNTPSVAIMEAELLNEKGKAKIETNKSITLKAITSYASAKKYEWYESNDGVNWSEKPILVSTIDVNDSSYNSAIAPTNRLDVDISKVTAGSSKYYKVISYYNDEYVSSKYDETEGKYKEIGTGKHQEGTAEQIIEIKRKDETVVQKVVNTIKNIISKITTKIKGLFRK